MFISRMVISLSWSWGFTIIPSTGLRCMESSHGLLGLVEAGLGQLSVASVEQRFEYAGGRRSRGSEGSSWLSPVSPGCCSTSRSTQGSVEMGFA